jgi:hypothetical protein
LGELNGSCSLLLKNRVVKADPINTKFMAGEDFFLFTNFFTMIEIYLKNTVGPNLSEDKLGPI